MKDTLTVKEAIKMLKQHNTELKDELDGIYEEQMKFYYAIKETLK